MKKKVLTAATGIALAGVIASQAPSQAQNNTTQMMLDRAAVHETIDALFINVDTKAWGQVRGVLADQIRVDFTSLNGGQPANITGDQLVGAWTAGLHKEKTSLHMTSNYRITVNGNHAEAFLHGYAWNQLVGASAKIQGGAVWETWGNYQMTLERQDNRWRINSLTYNSMRTAGNDTVRTHALQ